MKVKTKSKIEELRWQAGNALQKLRHLAKTDLAALEVLASELDLHVRGLKRDAIEAPEHYRKLMRRCASWPAIVSVDKEIQAEQIRFARHMELGDGAAENYKGRQWSRATPEVRAALDLKSCVINHGIKLPRLTRDIDTCKKWWKAARPFFDRIYGEHPEDHAHFKKYKKHPHASEKGWIRKAIFSKMPQAFHSIAPKQ